MTELSRAPHGAHLVGSVPLDTAETLTRAYEGPTKNASLGVSAHVFNAVKPR
jgi:hypothetical protein